MAEKNVNHLQACLKHGKRTVESMGKFKFVHNGITLITDSSKKVGQGRKELG